MLLIILVLIQYPQKPLKIHESAIIIETQVIWNVFLTFSIFIIVYEQNMAIFVNIDI